MNRFRLTVRCTAAMLMVLVGCTGGISPQQQGAAPPAGGNPATGTRSGNANQNSGAFGSPSGDNGPVLPVSGHPRLWLRADDLPRLRARASLANPLFGMALSVLAERATAEMDSGSVLRDDSGGPTYVSAFSEEYAELFAFMSLITSEEATRDDYARRARLLLMHVLNEAARGPADDQPFRDPAFALSDRSRWRGEAFALTVDWIYPYLSTADKATIRQVFLRWAGENVHAATTSFNHPEPIGVLNDPVLLSNPIAERFALNNYYAAHARNLGLMAMALDPGDDPDGALRGYLANSTGAWLYVIDHLLRNDARGGQAPEGFEYSPQSVGYVAQLLLALHTAGQDDPAVGGPQVMLNGDPFWSDSISAYLHALSPATVMHPDLGEVYQPSWYGDGQNYYAGDFIQAFAPIGLYDASIGNTERLQALRWIETHTAPGGEAEQISRVLRPESFRDAILYFMLFDPDAPAPADPHSAQPLEHYAPGVGHIFARTSWEADATWFTYYLGYISVDHQHGDGNQFQFYRRGEWLTKERTGYGDAIGSSDYHNTLALENDSPGHRGDYRDILYERGSQWLYGGASGDGQILAHSFGGGFVYATGDATALYNSDYEGSTDVLHASRSIVWLKPDHVIVYDRAASRTSSRFKRFWLNLPANANVFGDAAGMTTSSGQQLFVMSLLPTDAVLVSEPAEALDGEPANFEPMQFRLRIEAPGSPAVVRFLTVLQGADPGERAGPVVLIRSSGGAEFEGVQVESTVVVFPIDLDAPVSTLTYSAPADTTMHLIAGLMPDGSYNASLRSIAGGVEVTVTPGAGYRADSGGVLVLGAPR